MRFEASFPYVSFSPHLLMTLWCSVCRKHKPETAFEITKDNKTAYRSKLTCTQCNLKWIKCFHTPSNILQIEKLNDYSFIMVSSTNTISIYNTWTHQWIKPTSLPLFVNKIRSIGIDYDLQQLYIVTLSNESKKKFTIISRFAYNSNLNFSEISQVKIKNNFINQKDDYLSISSIFVDSRFHFIRHKNKGKTKQVSIHYIYDTQTQKIKQVYEFKSYYKQCALFHLKTQNILVMLRVIDHKSMLVACYSIESEKWNEKTKTYREYQNCSRFGFVLSKDQKRLVKFGGVYKKPKYGRAGKNKMQNVMSDKIQIMEIRTLWNNNMDFKQGKYHQCPLKDEYIALETGDGTEYFRLIILAYFAMCWIDENKDDKLNIPILPLDIINLICLMHERESFIHLFAKKQEVHYKINSKYIW